VRIYCIKDFLRFVETGRAGKKEKKRLTTQNWLENLPSFFFFFFKS